MKTVTYYDKGEHVMVKRGKRLVEMVIDGKWGAGEGHGYWCVEPGQRPEEGRDVPAGRIAGLAPGTQPAQAKGHRRRAG